MPAHEQALALAHQWIQKAESDLRAAVLGDWKAKEAMYKKHFPGSLITTIESTNLSKTAEKLVVSYFAELTPPSEPSPGRRARRQGK